MPASLLLGWEAAGFILPGLISIKLIFEMSPTKNEPFQVAMRKRLKWQE